MRKATALAGMAAGACAMYFLDPEHGRDRRRRFGDQFQRARDKVSDEQGHLAPRDVIKRTREMASDFRSRLNNGHREEIFQEARGTAREIASTQPWSSRARIMAAGVGGGLVLFGLRRTSLTGLALTSFGIGLVARALTNFQLERHGRSERSPDLAFTPRESTRAPYVGRDVDDAPNAAELRDRAAEEEMTAFTENPGSIPSD